MPNVPVEIKRLRRITEKQAGDISRLMKQLNPDISGVAIEKINRVARDNTIFCALHGDKIVGIALINFNDTFSYRFGCVNDVVVDKDHRGRRIGNGLMLALIEEAKKEGASCVDLTSNKKKKIANKMYKKLGFKKRDTNPYRLII